MGTDTEDFRTVIENTGTPDSECDNKGCQHTRYDHVDWRAEYDRKVSCRVIGCGCGAYRMVPGREIYEFSSRQASKSAPSSPSSLYQQQPKVTPMRLMEVSIHCPKCLGHEVKFYPHAGTLYCARCNHNWVDRDLKLAYYHPVPAP